MENQINYILAKIEQDLKAIKKDQPDLNIWSQIYDAIILNSMYVKRRIAQLSDANKDKD